MQTTIRRQKLLIDRIEQKIINAETNFNNRSDSWQCSFNGLKAKDKIVKLKEILETMEEVILLIEKEV